MFFKNPSGLLSSLRLFSRNNAATQPMPSGSMLDLIAGFGQAFTRPDSGLVMDGNKSQENLSLPKLVTPIAPLADKTDSGDWFKRWNVQPAEDARYLPEYPADGDRTLGADIRRGWHDSYIDFARNIIGEHAPQLAAQIPEPQSSQSFGNFIGQVRELIGDAPGKAQKNSLLSGILPGKGAPETEIPAPQPGPNAMPSESFGPPMPPFKNPSIPAPQNDSWFKPLDQVMQEVEDRQARGEILDENNNWVQRPVAEGPSNELAKPGIFKQPIPADPNSPLPEAIQKQMNDRLEGMARAKEFVKNWEKPSSDIYFPGGDSGVTYGYGRDMRYATEADIKKELMDQGVDAITANRISKGAGKYGAEARKFAEENQGFLDLTEEQQDAIFTKHFKRSDELMRQHLTQTAYDRLNPNQYAAIASIAYNTEGSLKGDKKNIARKDDTVLKKELNAKELNIENVKNALNMWTYSGGEEMPGLIKRR